MASVDIFSALGRVSRTGAFGIVMAFAFSNPATPQTCEHTTALSTGVSVAAETDPAPYGVTPLLARWSGVGVRSQDAMDWNLEAFDSKTTFPVCFSGDFGTSAGSAIDFLVTDWRFRAPQTDYVRASTPGQAGADARIEYEQAQFADLANRSFDLIPVGTTDVLTMRETSMLAGLRYIIEIWPSAGLSGLKCYLFAPVTAGSGWVPKADRVLEQDLVAGGGNLFYYTPSVSGMFGLVVTNENATAGNFYFCVKHCPFSISGISDNAPAGNFFLDLWPGFTPPTHTWGAVGERGEPGYSFNWDVAAGFRLQNGPYMTCSDSILSNQDSGLLTRVIAGDFRTNPLRLYTAHASLEAQPKVNPAGYVEWDNGGDTLVVNAAATAVTPPANNVLDAWSVPLVAGGTYDFHLVPNAGATATYRMLVFSNPSPGSEYWGTREQAVIDSPGPFGFAPVTTGLYGLVVVNDNGGVGGYSLAVTSTLVGVDRGASAPGISRIRNVQPNPSFGRTDVEFELARAGQAGLRVTDVLGRTVAVVSAAAHAAGANRLAWNGRTSRGVKPAAGVYFVTLEFDGLAQDRAKMILLR